MTDKPSGLFHRDRSWHPAALTPPYKTSVKRSPAAAPISMPSTLSEDTGPVFTRDILGPQDADLIHNFASEGQSAIGPRIIVYGLSLIHI